MATAKVQIDPLVFVRKRLAETKAKEWTRYAADSGVSLRTLQNIHNGKGAHYNTVIALHDAMRKADAAN